MAEIFLSYNRHDQPRAEHFARGLEAAGHSVWWDVALRAGEQYDAVTEAALRAAAAVVVLWSARSVASRWVRAEATLAQRLGSFVPCMIEPCERPLMFELTQTPDLSHWTGDPDDPSWRAFLAHVGEFTARRSGAELSAPIVPRPRQPLNERRQVTFLSAELVGGAQLAQTLDPEDWHDLLTAAKTYADPILAALDGAGKWTGHRLAATFGFPVAREDAAKRAVNAGLTLIERAEEIAADTGPDYPLAPALRIGVHTGEVLVTPGSEGEGELFGDGITLAAEARDLAQAGELLVTDTVRELTAGAFDLGEGQPGPSGLPLYRAARGASPDRRGWAGERSIGFVGREDEMALLRGRWQKAASGSAQLVLVRGEPGIGKTRLVEEFRAGLHGTGHRWIALQGSSMFPNTPYYAIDQLVAQLAGEEEGGSEGERPGAARLDLRPELAALLGKALGIRDAGKPGEGAPRLAEEERKRLLGLLVHAVFDLAERTPLVLLVDDLQWIDPSTLELIQMVIEQAADDRLLVLATARPEFRAPWPVLEGHSLVNLGRLSEAEVRQLIEETVGAADVAPDVVCSLLERADGVPLFAEELARMVAASKEAAGEGKLPATLRALLVARMDRLGPAREVLQVAAVLGRSFGHALLEAVVDSPAGELPAMLEQLAEEQLLFVRGVAPAATYRFKHALVQDAAYDTLPRRRARELHARIARTITERFPDVAERETEMLAAQWTRAGALDEAVATWLKLGEAAFSRAACKEAVAHYRAGLALTGQMPEGEGRERAELQLWSALNRALQQQLGYSDPQTVDAANRAVELARKSGVVARIMVENAQLWRATINAGDYRRADAIADEVLQLNAKADSRRPLAWVPYFHANARVQTDFYAGRLRQFESDFADLREALRQENLNHSPSDDVVAIGVSCLAAWMAGRSDLAFARAEEAIALGRSSGHPYARAVAHHFASTLSAFEGDSVGMLDHARQALAVSEENGFEYIALLARSKLGWASGAEGAADADIAAMQTVLARMESANALVGMMLNLNRLAITFEGAGRCDEALAAVERALVRNPQEAVARPQSLEIRGRLRAASGDLAGGEEDTRAAVRHAAEMGALALELSASVQLARLCAGCGRKADAIAALEAALGHCDEATLTPARQTAQALLCDLRDSGARASFG